LTFAVVVALLVLVALLACYLPARRAMNKQFPVSSFQFPVSSDSRLLKNWKLLETGNCWKLETAGN